MTPRPRIPTFIALAAAVLPVLCPARDAAAAAPPPPPPNVVLILSDDQGWNDYGFMGHPRIRTPRLDQLARESLTFTRGYVPSSLCRASLASIITGLHPHQHRITSNDPPTAIPKKDWGPLNAKMDSFIRAVPTLPRLLGEAGYVSFQSGKWWEGTPQNGGFTSGMTHGDPARGGRHGDEGLKIGRQGMEPVFNFIKSATSDNKPFFLWYAPFLPHNPHNPPARILKHYRDQNGTTPAVANYEATCEWFDETCGQLLDYLDDKDLRDNTLVIYICDNGWIQAPERRNRYAPRSKRSPYDGGLRTPLMIRWPGHAKPKTDRSTPVISTDIAPTVLAACGLKASPDMRGVDLLDSDALAKRKFIVGDVYLHNAIDLDDPLNSLNYRWVIEGDWKLIVPNPPNAPDSKTELFRITRDPFEKHNLAPENPETVSRLSGILDSWLPL